MGLAGAAAISQWPELRKQPVMPKYSQFQSNPVAAAENHQFLSSFHVGTLNDPFNHSPNTEVLRTWFSSRWKICSGMRVIPLSQIEMPSRQEGARMKAGEWFWNARRLTLEW